MEMSMAKPKLNGADYLLLLLYLDNKAPVHGAIRLTKMMFIFEKEITEVLKKNGAVIDKLPEFFAYNFGPFSKELYEQVEFFRGISFIKVTNLNAHEELVEVDDWEETEFLDEFDAQEDHLNQDGKYLKYEIYKNGINYTEKELLDKIGEEQKSILERFKRKINSLSPKQLLKYVYTNYPDYTEKSTIKKEVLDEQ